MNILFSECNCSSNLFKDFGRFDKVPDYLQSYIDALSSALSGKGHKDFDTFLFNPHYLAVILYGQRYVLISDCMIMPDAQLAINKYKRLRSTFTRFMYDGLTIRGDGFEHELVFSVV